ncbi:MAG: bifunctional phosphoribosylaminoimidazolecarboxamide formyltransferase/IMP cyclohydrolase [Bacilli bacterium]
MKRALISVSDKTNVVQFAQNLLTNDYEIISTGGTLKLLQENDIKVTAVSEITGFEEILDGRVKTLHPNIHGGILAKKDEQSHMDQLVKNNIEFIDLVVVNLYPFKKVIDNNCEFDVAIENIDIGGPTMLRSAAKNFEHVTVVCDVNDYDLISRELEDNGIISRQTRYNLAAKVFKLTAQYDALIASYLDDCYLSLNFSLINNLRYGENPHQSAMFYKSSNDLDYSITSAEKLHGKELSYNNIQDANAGLNLLKEYSEPTCVAIKHLNPCGVGSSNNISLAFDKAFKSDPISIFGGIVTFNRRLDKEVALKLADLFLEIIIAPDFSDNALEVLTKKKNIRILKVKMNDEYIDNKNITSVNGGILIQDVDDSKLDTIKCVSNNKVYNEDEVLFAWKICKHIKSNGIVVTSNNMSVGIGVGQTSRIASCEIALESARKKGFVDNLILASDAFFPFDDAIVLANKYGVKTIISTGGSVNDDKVIKKCNEYGITLIFTGIRNFKH